ncbi:hypothetical protein R1sor_008016 [Riccia sorocarpa]|uniref:Uncharacterized protein n=1 Tax=Riccia sorocarpa TaxID=122646 RepID=A0ABD3HS55_9MARC
MNEAISRTEILADIPIVLNGDIRTTSVKRKSPYSIAISKEDTHRPDKVAKTQQAFRLVRGRLRSGLELDAPTVEPMTFDPERTPNGHLNSFAVDMTLGVQPATLTGSSVVNPAGHLNSNVTVDMTAGVQPATLAGSRVFNTAGHMNFNVMVEMTSGVQPATLAGSRVVNSAAETHRVNVPQPQRSTVAPEIVHLPEDPVNHIDTTQGMPDMDGGLNGAPSSMPSASTILTISSDSKSAEATGCDEVTSSDVEILDSTPRNRPPTRRNPTVREVHTGPTETHTNATITGPTQFGMGVVESDVDEHKGHISRTSYRGAGPVCSAATPGRQAPRALCKTKLRSSGFQRRGLGVIGLTFMGTSTFMAIQRTCQFWFCPKKKSRAM